MNLKKDLKLRQILPILVQIALICFWFSRLNQHELFSKEGYQYSKYNGTYFICGVLAVVGMLDRLFSQVQLPKKQCWILSGFAALYTAATVLANYPVFEPLTEMKKLIGCAGALLGGFCVGFHVLTCAVRRLPILSGGEREKRQHGIRFYLLTFASIACIYLLYFFCVAYPGYFTTDSFSAIGQCLTGEYNNSLPFWHTLMIELCMKIGLFFGGEGNSAVCVYGIVQSLLMAAVFAYALVTLYQAGLPKWCIAMVYGLYTFLSYHLAYSATMWKDVPFSAAALLIVVSAYRIMKGIGKSRGLNDIIFVLGGFFFCLMRTNGWYSYLVMALVMALVLRKHGRKLLIMLCAVLAAGWICNNPVLDALRVSETDFVEAMAIPFQQIARVVADECEIAESDMEMLEEIFYVDRVKELYDPLSVDPVKFEAFRHEQRPYLRENLGDYIRLWIRLGVQHPWEYTKAWVDETQGYWNAGYHYWIYPAGGEKAEYGITRPVMDNPVKKVFDGLFSFLESTPPITQPLYGIGFQVWILIFCCIVCAVKKREEFLLTIPILVIVAGLWVGTPVFAEFRYAYPVFVTVPVLLCVTVFQTEKTPEITQ